MRTQPNIKSTKKLNIALVVSGVLALMGICLWFYQLTTGLTVTNMGNTSSWGLYITCFMFFVGLSAGGLIISSAPKLFGLKGFGDISKIAVWTSIVCTVLAMAFIVIDLGGPFRTWELIVFANLSSPLMWDVIVLSTYLVLSVVYLIATLRYERGAVQAKTMRIISGCAMIVAILVHSVTAWIFGLQKAHELWNTALLAPWFVSSALVCGLALVLVVVIALRKVGYLKLEQENIIKMTKLLGIFVAVDLYFFACELLTEGFPGGEGLHMVQILTTGALAPFFWLEVIGCLFTAAVAFIPRLRTTSLIVVGSALAIVGIFCKRVQLLVGGFQVQNLEYSTPISGPVHDPFVFGMVYFPSPIEVGVMIGVLGLGAFAFLAGLKYLPLAPANTDLEKASAANDE